MFQIVPFIKLAFDYVKPIFYRHLLSMWFKVVMQILFILLFGSLDKPTCKTNGVVIVGAAMNEPMRITCEVDAYPKPKADEWRWTVNNSLGSVKVTAVSI